MQSNQLSEDSFSDAEIHLASLDKDGLERFLKREILKRWAVFVSILLSFPVIAIAIGFLLRHVEAPGFFALGYFVLCGLFSFFILAKFIYTIDYTDSIRSIYSPAREFHGLCEEAVKIVSESNLADMYRGAVLANSRELCQQDIEYLKEIRKRDNDLQYCRVLHSK